jgi:hypothetical protein
MLGLFRLRAWCLATALSLAVGTAGASFEALLHPADSHDPCCPRAVEHDEAAHRYQPADSAGDDGAGHHCLACHASRSFRLDGGSAAAAAPPDDSRLHAPARTIGRTLAPALAGLPARSPPRFS